MSDHIPFEIQSEIIRRLPVKSIIQFRSVSKKWKSFIDRPEFINVYHINQPNPQHHLFVSYELDTVKTYTSIIDNNTFPQQKFPLIAPESLSLLRNTFILGSIDGLLCFCGDVDSNSRKVVIWNPTVRKSVGIVIPKASNVGAIVGFGVCPDTSDPKLVKINIAKLPSSMWEVEVFTLSTRVWKTVYMDAPFKSCDLRWSQVFVDGVIYFRAYKFLDQGVIYNFLISFDLKSEKFGEVCLPERLVQAHHLNLTKVNELLGLLEYYVEGEMWVCGVWSRKDGVNQPFTKMYTVKKPLNVRVLGFRSNAEVIIKLDHAHYQESGIKVYEPLSGQITGVVTDVGINDVGINGYRGTLSVKSYTETLILLNELDSIKH